MIKVVQSLR
ncbi:hypothetical protein S40285_09757, partial [Stachybotrys chlorohalonatus IBT 40285]